MVILKRLSLVPWGRIQFHPLLTLCLPIPEEILGHRVGQAEGHELDGLTLLPVWEPFPVLFDGLPGHHELWWGVHWR